jgi:hypothetical protein
MWKLRSDLTLSAILGHLVLWFVLVVVTCGFAAFLFPYSAGVLIINATTLVDERGSQLGRLRCNQDVTGHIGHALLWWLLTLVTLGVAGFVYMYRVSTDLLNATTVEGAR